MWEPFYYAAKLMQAEFRRLLEDHGDVSPASLSSPPDWCNLLPKSIAEWL
jgi:hypothetical protein